MTEVSFVDRRTDEQRDNGLATQVLFWYDEEGRGRKRRRRTNGIAITTDGTLLVSRATCSRKDQFIKSKGRLVVEKRILGRAQRHCWRLAPVNGMTPEGFAAAYEGFFPDDEMGVKRAYNVGKIFTAFSENQGS